MEAQPKRRCAPGRCWRLALLLALLVTTVLLGSMYFPAPALLALPWAPRAAAASLAARQRASLPRPTLRRATPAASSNDSSSSSSSSSSSTTVAGAGVSDGAGAGKGHKQQLKSAYQQQHAGDEFIHDVTADHCGDVEAAAVVKGLRGQPPGMAEHLASQRAATTYAGESRFKWCAQDVRGAAVPRLHHVVTVRSLRHRKPHAVTIVTQLSLDRLYMLENQCQRWDGPIAAVVYMPLVAGKIITMDRGALELNNTDVSEGVRRVYEFHQRLEGNGTCYLDIEFVVEERCNVYLAGIYPFNALRNRALMVARTEAVFLLDVDFVVSTSLAAELGSKAEYSWLTRLLRGQTAIVVPAFQTANRYDVKFGVPAALAVVTGGKQAALAALANGTIAPFEVDVYPAGHTPTDYERWAALPAAASGGEYAVEYQTGYEPYIIMHKDYVPWYDERFRGYGWDKVIHLLHIASHDTIFVVHPRAFVVHVPHRRAATQGLTQATHQKEVLHSLYLEAKTDIARERFAPITSFPHQCG